MRIFARHAVTAALALFAACASVQADEAYFVIRPSGGRDGAFAVTDAVVQRLGARTFETTLPGMDNGKHLVSGPLLRDLLKEAKIRGATATAVAIDKYEAEIPVSDFEEFDVIAATEIDGRRLSVRDKGPAWIVYPRSDNPGLQTALHEARSVWQLKELSVR